MSNVADESVVDKLVGVKAVVVRFWLEDTNAVVVVVVVLRVLDSELAVLELVVVEELGMDILEPKVSLVLTRTV